MKRLSHYTEVPWYATPRCLQSALTLSSRYIVLTGLTGQLATLVGTPNSSPPRQAPRHSIINVILILSFDTICHLILFVSSTNSLHIVRRQCCLVLARTSNRNNFSWVHRTTDRPMMLYVFGKEMTKGVLLWRMCRMCKICKICKIRKFAKYAKYAKFGLVSTVLI